MTLKHNFVIVNFYRKATNQLLKYRVSTQMELSLNKLVVLPEGTFRVTGLGFEGTNQPLSVHLSAV